MPEKNIKTIAVANQKGGVGKTTTSLNLGASFSRLGYKTLVIDLDPHASATIHLAYYPEQIENTSFELIKNNIDWDKLSKLIYSEERLYFDFIPGDIRLSDLEVDLKNSQGKGTILKKNLQLITSEYDYIILDCPPQLSVLLVNALVAADLTIIPIQTEFLALHGLRLIFDTINKLNKALSEPIFYRTLATMYDRRIAACRRVLELLNRKLGNRIFSTIINIDTKFREASAQGKVVYEIAPKTRGCLEYIQLAKEIKKL